MLGVSNNMIMKISEMISIININYDYSQYQGKIDYIVMIRGVISILHFFLFSIIVIICL